MRHDLARDAYDAGKVRVVYAKMKDQHTDLFTKLLGIQFSM